jgi:hypothetical protein
VDPDLINAGKRPVMLLADAPDAIPALGGAMA